MIRKYRDIKIPVAILLQSATDPELLKVLASILIIKANYTSSVIVDFSVDKLRRLLHCNRDTAKSVLSYILTNDLGRYNQTTTGRCDLILNRLPYGDCERGETVSYIHVCNSPAGKHIFNYCGDVEALDNHFNSVTVQTLHTVENILQKMILGYYIKCINKIVHNRRQSASLKMCGKRVEAEVDRARKAFEEKEKSKKFDRSNIMDLFREQETYKHFLNDHPLLRKKLHHLYDNAEVGEFSMYAKHSTTMETLAKMAFGDTLSLRTVKRLLSQMINEDKTIRSHRHCRSIFVKENDTYTKAEFFRNVMGESCVAYKSTTLTIFYNKRHKKDIANGKTEKCAIAYIQPWANTYELLSSDFRDWTKFTRKKAI